MRVAVISDIHGNCVALDAVLEDIQNRPEVAQTICLGDAIQGGVQPAEVVARLKQLGCPVIMGNADSFVLKGVASDGSPETVSPDMKRVRDWTFERIGHEGAAFIESFKDTYELDLEEAGQLLCFHGSPASFDEVISPESSNEEVAAAIGPHDHRVFTGGHTHIQWIRNFGDQIYFNPGSVGLAYNRYLPRESFYFYPLAQYAILETQGSNTWVEFCTVPFDVDELSDAAVKNGHPFAERTGPSLRPKKA